jgi:hypothetical protein
MPYDDDDDLFGEEFDFVDDDEHGDDEGDEKPKDEPAPKKKRPVSRDKADKPSPRGPKRARPSSPVNKREPRREPDPNKAGDGIAGPPAPKPPVERAPVGYIIDDVVDDEPSEVEPEPTPAPVASGPPADHLVHIYEYGNFKRTIARKFTDEEAVGFAEEYTRTGKAYGRYAIATPDDEEPAPTFAGAAKG